MLQKAKRHNYCMNFANILQVFFDGSCYWKMEALTQSKKFKNSFSKSVDYNK